MTIRDRFMRFPSDAPGRPHPRDWQPIFHASIAALELAAASLTRVNDKYPVTVDWIDWSFETGARARPARPDGDTVSGASRSKSGVLNLERPVLPLPAATDG